jgi:hypothetical protein
MTAQHATVDMHDLARLSGIRLQPVDNRRVAAGRHEADVLTVRLVRNDEAEFLGDRAHGGLCQTAERKAEIIELLLRGRIEKVALIAIGIVRAIHRAAIGATISRAAAFNVVTGDERRAAEIFCGRKQILELHGLIAGNAGHRRFAARV